MSAVFSKSVPVSDISASAGNSFRKFFHLLWFRESLIFILCFLFFGYFACLGIDPHHDGVMMIPALRVAEGQVIFRDVFYQYGLLVPLLQGMAVALFGAELLVIRLLTVCFYAGSAVLLDVLWKRFLPSKISFLVPVLFCLFSACTMVTFHSWSSVYALFFMLLYALFMLRYLEKESSSFWNLFFAGVSAGLTWGCRTPCGAVTIFAAMLVLLGLNWFTGKNIRQIARENGVFAGGVLTFAALAVIYISVSGAWDDFIKQNFSYVADFVYGRGAGGSWQYFCDSMFPFFQDEYWFCNAFFAFMPLLAMTMLYLDGRRGILDGTAKMREILPLAALLILGLGSWHQYYPVPCVRHLYWGGAPLIGAFLFAVCRLWQSKKLLSMGLVIFLLLVLVLGIYPRIYGIYMRAEWGTRYHSVTPGIRGIKLSSKEKNIVDFVKAGEAAGREFGGFVNWGSESLFSVMVERDGFQDLQFYRTNNKQYPDYDGKVMQYVIEKRPAVMVDQDIFIPGYRVVAAAEYMGKYYFLQIPDK